MQNIMQVPQATAEANVVIVVEPGITALFQGQLISRSSLKSLVAQNQLSMDEILITPYTKERHLTLIENLDITYTHITAADYLLVH